ncbi:MAG: hypothetical protein RIG61_00150 [Deltaproteobacteria bacterium]
MKSFILFFSMSLLLALLTFAPKGGAEEEAAYVPEPGDEVVIYTIKYKPEDFEKGKKIQVEGFGKAMTASGQSRATYFLADPENSVTLAVSFFKKSHSVEDWHSHEEREKVLEKLKPLWREPVSYERFTLIDSHSTD